MKTIQRFGLSTVILASIMAFVGTALLPFATSAESLVLGQNHSYDVKLRGDGSAVVNARISVANDSDKAIKTYTYNSTKGTLSDILAFQQIVCSELPPYVPMPETDSSTTTPTPEATETVDINGEDAVRTTTYPECYPKNNSYTRPAYNRGEDAITYYQPAYTTIYKKVTVKQSGESFTLTPPTPLEPSEEATFVLIYNLDDVSVKKFGVYNYDFRTLKTNSRIQHASVAISVDNDYVLEGSADDKTNYKPKSTSSVDISESLKQGSNLSTSDSSSVSSYVGSIGNNGTIVKTTSSLASGETFNVTGRFATNEFLLHWPRTLLRVILVVLAFAIIVYLLIRWRRRLQKIKAEQAINAPVENSEPVKPNESSETASESVAVSSFEPTTSTVYATAPRANIINVNLQALPFYDYFRYRRVGYMFFGWLCAIATGVFIGLMFLILAWLMSQSTYAGYGNEALAIIAYLCISAATLLGVLVFAIGLPYLYARTVRGTIHIILHTIGLFILIALFSIIALSAFTDKPTYDYPDDTPYYNYGDDYLKVQ